MKNQRVLNLILSVALCLGVLLVMVILVESSSAAVPTVRYVATTGSDTTDCSIASSPCRTVQHAVDAANANDKIKIAAGTYVGVNARPRDDIIATGTVTQVVYLSKTVTIRGGYDSDFSGPSDPIANPTTLDAQREGRVFYIIGGITPVIENLSIGQGQASLGAGMYVYSATATISHCTVEDSWAYNETDPWIEGDGGGIYVSHSAATLVGNTVQNNRALSTGGGLSLDQSRATLADNIVRSNQAASGGGLYLNSCDAALTGNTVERNGAHHSLSGSYLGAGGGLYLNHSTATLTHNTVQYNQGGGSRFGRGGGLALYSSSATLTDNIVQYNHAPGWVSAEGGGLFLMQSAAVLTGNVVQGNGTGGGMAPGTGGGLCLVESIATLYQNVVISNSTWLGGGLYLSDSDVTLVNTIVADNQASDAGGGLYIERSSPRLLHTTIARNTGASGVSLVSNSTTAMTNTILVSHTVGLTVTAGSTATLETTLWGSEAWGNQTDWGGEGTIFTGTVNLWAEPGIVDPGSGDYHIGLGSAAVNAGIHAGILTDIDGNPRPDWCFFDIGADELLTGNPCSCSYLPLIVREKR